VKLALPGILLFATITFVNVGCATGKPQAKSSPLDVGEQQVAVPAYEPPASPSPALAYQPPPVYQPAPVLAEPIATTPAKPPAAPASVTYTVQKGDTLFAIAKQHYGDGNKWKKIASANPGLNPGAVKAGQKLIIPQ
jgi:nucleoid-associated protein YgaU